MKLKFYGTRGSIPAPGPDTVKYGGNTTCLEVVSEQGDEYIFDAGSGIRQLGLDLAKRGAKKAKIFITHDHWDHIQGFPFFTPAYVPGNQIEIYSGNKRVIGDLQEVQERQDGVAEKGLEARVATNKDERENYTKRVFEGQQDRAKGYFPVEITDMGATLKYVDLAEEEIVENGFNVSYRMLNHPQGVFCYRIQEDGKSVVFATDYEHDNGSYDRKLVEWAKGADVLIIDGQYTPEEYESKKGWGHSQIERICELAKEAGVKRMVITHHDPASNDEKLDQMLKRSRNYMRRIGGDIPVEYAREGMEIEINAARDLSDELGPGAAAEALAARREALALERPTGG